MNARQAAKHYKQKYEELRRRLNPREVQEIKSEEKETETVTVCAIIDDRIPEEYQDQKLTQKLAEFLGPYTRTTKAEGPEGLQILKKTVEFVRLREEEE